MCFLTVVFVFCTIFMEDVTLRCHLGWHTQAFLVLKYNKTNYAAVTLSVMCSGVGLRHVHICFLLLQCGFCHVLSVPLCLSMGGGYPALSWRLPVRPPCHPCGTSNTGAAGGRGGGAARGAGRVPRAQRAAGGGAGHGPVQAVSAH